MPVELQGNAKQDVVTDTEVRVKEFDNLLPFTPCCLPPPHPQTAPYYLTPGNLRDDDRDNDKDVNS